MRNIPEFPKDTPNLLREFLHKIFNEIRLELNNKDKLVIRTIVPTKPEIGKMYYFGKPVLPSITSEGIWIFKAAGGWTQVG